MTFPEQLTILRKQKGLSQEALAAQLGVSRQAVSKWETGEAQPDLGNLMALADALDTCIDNLCGRASTTAAEPAQPAAAPKQKHPFLFLASAVLAIILLIPAVLGWINYLAPAAPVEPPKPFTVGASFVMDSESSSLICRITPSLYDPACTYRLLFVDEHDQETGLEATYSDGVLVCSLPAAGRCSYPLVSITAVNSGGSSTTLVARNLEVTNTLVSWSHAE